MGSKGGSGTSSSTGGDTQSTVRYAPYLEAFHSQILNHGGSDTPDSSFADIFNLTLNASPYVDYEQLDIDEGFFGMTVADPTVTYEIKNFPSLWDMFGKFMGGLDVHDLWGQIYEDVIQGPEIENAVTAQSELLQDEIDTNVMPRFLAGMRDINSVQSTAFVVGKSIIQSAHVKSINKFSSQIRLQALSISNEQWSRHLSWDESVIRTFADIFKLYYATRLDMDRANLEYLAKDAMWNINLFENARSILGAMTGSAATSQSGNEPSTAQKAIGGALSGAAAGAMVGPMLGASALTGGIVGGLLGLGSAFL